MRSKLTVLFLATVVASLAPVALAATPAPSPDAAMERALGLSASTDRGAAPSPDEYCWTESQTLVDCNGCGVKARVTKQERLCCQYTGCRAWETLSTSCPAVCP